MNTAEEEWMRLFGYEPTEEDFAWPLFRDAYYAGKEQLKDEYTGQEGFQTFYDVCRTKLLLSQPQTDAIIKELKQWISNTAGGVREWLQNEDRNWVDGYNTGKQETILKITESL